MTVVIDAAHRNGDRLQIPFSITGQLPAGLPPGLYRPVVSFSTDRPGVSIGYRSYVDIAAGELSGDENIALHHKNLQAAIRDNAPLNCPAELGQYGLVSVAMGNLSWFEKKMIAWDAEKGTVARS